MPTSEQPSRPTYVYLLALTALLLFGTNFAVSMADRSCDAQRIVHHARHDVSVEVVAPLPPAPPIPDMTELNREMKRAQVEIERATQEMRASAAKRSPARSFIVVN